MKVTLVEYTGKGSANEKTRACDVMIWTKHTRVEMGPGSLEAIEAWPWEKKETELKYMANTIPSSWEFLDYTFMIQDVTRALTHQLVRARTMSFAQQTMQILDMSQGAGWTYETGPTLTDEKMFTDHPEITRKSTYAKVMEVIGNAYKELILNGVKIEDARNLLPTGIHTNIVMKCNMRSLVQLIHSRESPRNLGEIRVLMVALKAAVLEVHPWMSIFLERTHDQATTDLDAMIQALPDAVDPLTKTTMMKLVDQCRSKS